MGLCVFYLILCAVVFCWSIAPSLLCVKLIYIGRRQRGLPLCRGRAASRGVVHSVLSLKSDVEKDTKGFCGILAGFSVLLPPRLFYLDGL